MAYITNQPSINQVSSSRKLNLNFTVGVVGSLLLIIGAFLSWYVVKIDLGGESSVTNVGGMDKLPLTDNSAGGVIAVGLGVVALALTALGILIGKKWLAVLVIVVGLLAAAFMFLKVGDTASTDGLSISTGFGMYISMAGALMILAGGVAALVGRRR